MIKTLLGAVLALFAAAAFAAVDVNKADMAALDSVKGIGPALATKLLDERKKGNFKDWNDLIDRVSGVGSGNAARFSAAGLTVNDASYAGASPAAAKTTSKTLAPTKATSAAQKTDKPQASTR
ncbi:MAG: helix-hairpin-helix domain-containing protein [Methylibium sp.]|uniref:ComEA family DNA-binding protein n=1 Tax=Methylibium sp. TaxID=2067992 RepID=UPI0017F04624|nr:helix-hairpin-helix domain-containing protein [Methylibium sp.]MBA2722214.1 helix-hairpin-helix domain-containing protein [Methylibium sp.]MBA3590585.1 helix-hairpin-helix domain-containing protein [Methylibium sp.]MBA3623864.1 helix-hairpin-helix domain-containing protein [Methylibium sp.]